MVFVYIILIGVLILSSRKEKLCMRSRWVLAFTALVLTAGIFIYHALSPIGVHL